MRPPLTPANQRYYSYQGGRFLTPDPYRAPSALANPQSWNRYSYVEGDPINFNDPAGLMRVCPSGTHTGPDAMSCVADSSSGGGGGVSGVGDGSDGMEVVADPWSEGGGGGDDDDPVRPECDKSVDKNNTYLDFIDAHRADATLVAGQLHTDVQNILGLSALESTFGTSRFARDGNNFFGLHSSTAKPLPGQIGIMPARRDPSVGMAMFRDFLGSAEAFAQTKGRLITGTTDPTRFATILQTKGKFGIGPKGPVPTYVRNLTNVITNVAIRLDCDK